MSLLSAVLAVTLSVLGTASNGALAQTTTSLTAPANNNVYFSPATITLRASASASAPTTITRVEFYANGALIGTDTSKAFSFIWTNPAAGTYTLTAIAYDSAAGQMSSAARTITVNAANLPPTVNLTSPANNASFALPATVTLKASATAPEANDTLAKVDFFANGALIGTDTSRAFSFTWTNPDPGTYTLTAVATDGQGAQTISVARTVKVDASNLPPTVHLTSPANKALFNAPASITLKANASAPEANDTVAKVEFFDGATLVGTATAAPYSATIANAAAGTHVLTAVATDGQGAQTTSAARTITVNAATNLPPTVALTSPANGATFTAPGTVPLTAMASDSDGSIARVDFFQGATSIGTATSAPYTFSWTNVAQGSYAITATATDNGGAMTSSAVVNITVNSGVAQVYYIVPDHLNTPRVIEDGSGTVVWRWDQTEPFGNAPPNDNPSALGAFEFNLRFPGQYFDGETNLHHNYYRDYDQRIGSYLESDPIGLRGGINTYAYVNANPLKWTDRSGLVKWKGWVKSFNWLAYSRDEYELTSECKCGFIVTIKVTVDSLGKGIGAAASRSDAEFEDRFPCPNPMAFAGLAYGFSAVAGVGSIDVSGTTIDLGFSYNRTLVGVAHSVDSGPAEVVGAAIGPGIGLAKVADEIRSEPCCGKK